MSKRRLLLNENQLDIGVLPKFYVAGVQSGTSPSGDILQPQELSWFDLLTLIVPGNERDVFGVNSFNADEECDNNALYLFEARGSFIGNSGTEANIRFKIFNIDYYPSKITAMGNSITYYYKVRVHLRFFKIEGSNSLEMSFDSYLNTEDDWTNTRGSSGGVFVTPSGTSSIEFLIGCKSIGFTLTNAYCRKIK
jgi:hypothetical protein